MCFFCGAFGDRDGERAFHSFFHEFASETIRLMYVAAHLYGVRRATAAAVVLGPAVGTSLFLGQVGGGKEHGKTLVERTVHNVTDLIPRFTVEPMAGENVTVGRDGEIFVTGVASDQPFRGLRIVVYVVVEVV